MREVEEPFRKGQKGSSAMPHKRNPVVCERICGLARVLRGNAQVGLENVALWHERDITHSSAERIVLPDSTILLDQVLALTLRVVRGMTVHADRMLANLEITSGALFSQRVLLALVAGGMQRDDAYRIVQRLGQQAWDTQTPLRTLLEHENVQIDLDEVFDYGYYTRHVPDGAGAAGGDPIAVLIHGAPEISATLFHEVPVGIGDPFLYLEIDGRRAATVSVLDARQGLPVRRSRSSTRRRSASTTWSRPGVDRLALEAELSLRAAQQLGISEASVPPEFPLFVADHLRANGIELTVDDDEFIAPPAGQVGVRARGHPARPEGRRRGDGRRAVADPRAARRAHLRGRARRDAGGGRGARLRVARRRDRLPRRRSPRSATTPAPA